MALRARPCSCARGWGRGLFGEHVGAPLTHLGVVGDGALRHRALLLHQEAEPSPLLRQSRLIPVRDVVFQLPLLVADGFDVLEGAEKHRGGCGYPFALRAPTAPLAGDETRSIPRDGVSGGASPGGCPWEAPSTGHTHTCACTSPPARPYSSEPPHAEALTQHGGRERAGGRDELYPCSHPLTKRVPDPQRELARLPPGFPPPSQASRRFPQPPPISCTPRDSLGKQSMRSQGSAAGWHSPAHGITPGTRDQHGAPCLLSTVP